MLRLTEADLTAPLAEPTEAELTGLLRRQHRPLHRARGQAHHLCRAAARERSPTTSRSMRPRCKQLYDERIAEFVQPERRLVERLVFPTRPRPMPQRPGWTRARRFEALVAERGLTLDDIDLGDCRAGRSWRCGRGGLRRWPKPAWSGPLPSDLGPALFRMNGVLAAEETTFEEARETLADRNPDRCRPARDRRQGRGDRRPAGRRRHAGGSGERGRAWRWHDRLRRRAAERQRRSTAIRPSATAADAVQEGDFPEAIVLEDGGLVALRLDEIVPAAPIPFDEVRDEVAAAWRADALAKALSARAIEIKAAVEGGRRHRQLRHRRCDAGNRARRLHRRHARHPAARRLRDGRRRRAGDRGRRASSAVVQLDTHPARRHRRRRRRRRCATALAAQVEQAHRAGCLRRLHRQR